VNEWVNESVQQASPTRRILLLLGGGDATPPNVGFVRSRKSGGCAAPPLTAGASGDRQSLSPPRCGCGGGRGGVGGGAAGGVAPSPGSVCDYGCGNAAPAVCSPVRGVISERAPGLDSGETDTWRRWKASA
jgi:hypothetical protein